MAYNGSGTFLIDSTGQPVVFDTVIDEDVHNALTADLATGLTNAICKDGQSVTSSVIPFANGISTASVTNDTGLAHGTYAASITNTTNVDSSSAAGAFNYYRLGNQVYVTGQITVNATAAASMQTTIGISLPVASDLTQTYQATGVLLSWANSIIGYGIGDTANNRMRFDYLSSSTGDVAFAVMFNYQVL